MKADFALAFWMAHEVDDLDRLFAEILAALKPGGLLLLVEPLAHVPQRRFEEIVAAAVSAGFESRRDRGHPAQPGGRSQACGCSQIPWSRGYWVLKPRMAR